MNTLFFIIGLILFVALVVVHEFGHALVAKRNGVEVDEFGIGFPPRAWKKKLKNGTILSINWLPLGGFVRLRGEHDAASGPGTYGGATMWVKAKILMAGVFVNWVTAVIIFTFLALVGMPKILPNQFSMPADTVLAQNDVVVAEVVANSPAAKAGLKPGDKIATIAGEKVTDAAHFSQQTAAHAGQTVDLQIERGGATQNVSASLNKERAENQGYLGVGPSEQTLQRATWSAPIVGVGVTVQFTYETVKGLITTVGDLFQAKFAQAGQNVAGPVGVVSILKSSSDSGIIFVLFLIGIISLTLAVMNALPIPALDGGRLFVTLLYRMRGKQLTKEREESIQATGFIALMVLVALITVVDVGRFFH